MFPPDWQPGYSSAIEAYRYLAADGVLQIAFIEGRKVYDYPCPPDLFQRFVNAGSRGQFVNAVLRPYARQQGWSRAPYPWPW